MDIREQKWVDVPDHLVDSVGRHPLHEIALTVLEQTASAQSRAMEPRDHHPRRAFVFNRTGAASTHLMAWCRRSRRGRRTRHRHSGGSPRNLGRPAAPSRQELARGSQTPIPQAPLPASGWRERRTQAHGRVPPGEAQAKPGGMVRRESERLIVCAGQRDGQEGSSPSGARMRSAVSKGRG